MHDLQYEIGYYIGFTNPPGYFTDMWVRQCRVTGIFGTKF